MEIEKRIERIVIAKSSQGLTNQQLADMAGMAKSTIYRVFGGKVTPDSMTLQLLETALGITDTPPMEPMLVGAKDSDTIKHITETNERRVDQLRCYYNRFLAEKDRSMKTLKYVVFILFGLLLTETIFLILMIYIDARHPDIGWIRQQLGLTIRQFLNFA